MNKCVRCFSYAINPDMYGREAGVDLDLCDVCYWRKRATVAGLPVAEIVTGDREGKMNLTKEMVDDVTVCLLTRAGFTVQDYPEVHQPSDRAWIAAQKEALAILEAAGVAGLLARIAELEAELRKVVQSQNVVMPIELDEEITELLKPTGAGGE